MKNVKNLVVRVLEEGVDAVAKNFRKVDDAVADVNEGLKSNEQAAKATGEASELSAAQAERALRRLGVQSEASAQRQIAAAEEQNRKIQASTELSEREKRLAAESTARRIEQINARLAQGTESQFDRMARSVINSFDRMGRRAQRISRGIGIAFAAIGAAGAATAGIVFRNVQVSAQWTDELVKLSRETGIATNRLAAYGFAAEDSGVSASEFGNAIRNLRQGLNDNAELLRSYGVQLRDNNGVLLETGEIFRNVIGALNGIDDEFERAGLAAEIFGNRIGPRLASLIDGGTNLLDQYKDDLDELGFDFEAAGLSAEEFNDNLTAVFRRLRLLRTVAAAPLFQPLADVFARLTEIIGENSTAIKDFAGTLGGGVVTLFEDFVAILDGRDGDVQNEWLLQAVGFAKTFGAVMKDTVFPTVKAVFEFLQDAPPWVSKLVVLFALFGAAVGPVLTVVVALGKGIFAIFTWVKGIVTGSAAVAGIFGSLLKTLRAVVLAAGIFAGTVGAVPLAITAAVALLGTLAFKFRDELLAGFKSVISFFTDGIMGVIDRVKNFFAGFRDTRVGRFLSENLPGFMAGGFTGNMSPSSVAGVVHGKEFVFDAGATQRWGVNALESLRRGIVPPSMMRSDVPAVAGGGSFANLGRVTFEGPNGERIPALMDRDAYEEVKRRQRQMSRASGGRPGRFA